MGMLETLEQTDRSVTLFLNTFLDTAWSGPVWAFITDKHTWYPVYALLIVFLFWKMGWKRALVTLGAIALTILAADQLANVVKAATMRLRPCHDPWMIENGIELPIGKGGGKYGFFSAHAANSFALVLSIWIPLKALSDGARRFRWFIWTGCIWAMVVSLSRVCVGRHFAGDILVGAAVGLLIGWAFGLLSRWVCSLMDKKV